MRILYSLVLISLCHAQIEGDAKNRFNKILADFGFSNSLGRAGPDDKLSVTSPPTLAPTPVNQGFQRIEVSKKSVDDVPAGNSQTQSNQRRLRVTRKRQRGSIVSNQASTVPDTSTRLPTSNRNLIQNERRHRNRFTERKVTAETSRTEEGQRQRIPSNVRGRGSATGAQSGLSKLLAIAGESGQRFTPNGVPIVTESVPVTDPVAGLVTVTGSRQQQTTRNRFPTTGSGQTGLASAGRTGPVTADRSGQTTSNLQQTGPFNFDQTLKEFGFNPRLLTTSSFRSDGGRGSAVISPAGAPPQPAAAAPVINPFRLNNLRNTEQQSGQASNSRVSDADSGLSNLLAIAGDPQVNIITCENNIQMTRFKGQSCEEFHIRE